MYLITFATSFSLLVFCQFSTSEPPPGHLGYGPASPVEFPGSNSFSNRQQYNNAVDFGSQGSYSDGSPTYSSFTRPNYKSSSNYHSHAGVKHFGGPANYKGSGKGEASSSYISIVHGNNGGRPKQSYSPSSHYTGVGQKAASSTGYSGVSSFGNAGSYSSPYSSDGKSTLVNPNSYVNSEIGGFGGHSSNGYSASVSDNGVGKVVFGAGSPYSSSEIVGGSESYTNGLTAGGYKGFEISDDVGSYTHGGPTYVTSGSSPYTARGSAYNSGIQSHYAGGGGSRGSGAYSTTNVIGQANYGGRIGHEYTPSRFSKQQSTGNGIIRGGDFSSLNKVHNFPVENSRALKSNYNSAEATSLEADDDFVGAYSNSNNSGRIKVQSSYSAAAYP